METILLISSAVLWVVLIFNLLITFALVKKINQLSYPDRQLDLLENGQMAPNFTASMLDGTVTHLSDYLGRKLILLFISPSCEACHDKMRVINNLYPNIQKYQEELVVVSLANKDNTQKYIDELAFSPPVLIAPRESNQFAELYKVVGTPWHYVINGDGYIESGGPLDNSWYSLITHWSIPSG